MLFVILKILILRFVYHNFFFILFIQRILSILEINYFISFNNLIFSKILNQFFS